MDPKLICLWICGNIDYGGVVFSEVGGTDTDNYGRISNIKKQIMYGNSAVWISTGRLLNRL
jgi:hypothetical protein